MAKTAHGHRVRLIVEFFDAASTDRYACASQPGGIWLDWKYFDHKAPLHPSRCGHKELDWIGHFGPGWPISCRHSRMHQRRPVSAKEGDEGSTEAGVCDCGRAPTRHTPDRYEDMGGRPESTMDKVSVHGRLNSVKADPQLGKPHGDW